MMVPVELNTGIGILNLLALAFYAGETWSRIRRIDRIVNNGLSQNVSDIKRDMAVITERCTVRGAELERLRKKVDDD